MITKVTSQKPKTTTPPTAAGADGELAAEFSRLLDSLKVEVTQQGDGELQAVEFPVETNREPVRETKEQKTLPNEILSSVQVPLQREPVKEKAVDKEATPPEKDPLTLEQRAPETRTEVAPSKEEAVDVKAEEFKGVPLLPTTPLVQNTVSKEEKADSPQEVSAEQSEASPQFSSELPTESSRPQLPKNEAAPVEKGEVQQRPSPTTSGVRNASETVGQIPAEASDGGAKVAEPEVESVEPTAPREVREPLTAKAPIQQGAPAVNAIATAVAASVPGEQKGVAGPGSVKGPAISGVDGVAKSSSSPGGPVGGAFMKSTGETAGQTTKGSKELSRTQSLRALEMVETALKEATRSKDGKSISFRLDPPQLGQVKVDVSLRDGALHARIVAESPEVNQMLRERGHELQGMLRGLGLNVDKVSVSITSDGQQMWSEQRSNQQQEKRDPEQEMLQELMFVETQKARSVSLDQKRQEMPLDHWVA